MTSLTHATHDREARPACTTDALLASASPLASAAYRLCPRRLVRPSLRPQYASSRVPPPRSSPGPLISPIRLCPPGWRPERDAKCPHVPAVPKLTHSIR